MPDDLRIRELLEKALEDSLTPEQVCRDAPELLPEVRRRWDQMKNLEAEVDKLFPSFESSDSELKAKIASPDRLPNVEGYEVREVLGRGGMGVVYRAWHKRLNRPVALKMLLAGAFSSASERENLTREAQAVASLSHPHIVTVYDVGEMDGLPWFSMELVDGPTLAAGLLGQPQPPVQTADLIATLAEAAHAAHRAGIAHKDLKPGNVLISSSGSPKIADFGLARRFEGESGITSGGRAGTPSYMAPEAILGKAGGFTPSVDIYSLGAMLYEMLTGRPPFRADTASETERQIVHEDPAPPSRLNVKVPRDLETICLKALHKEPHRRYESAAELAADLRRFLRNEPIHARRTGWAERTRRWVQRRPSEAALVALAFVAITIGTLAGFREWNRALEQRMELKKWDERLAFVIQMQNEGRFGEGRAILARIPDAGSNRLRSRIQSALDDLTIAEQLDSIRMSRGQFAAGGGIDYSESANRYQAAFQTAGLATVSEAPDHVAARLNDIPIRQALLNALDDWAACADASERDWILAVARKMDPDPWRDQVRDNARWADIDHLAELGATADIEHQPVNLLVAMATRWRRLGGNPIEYLKRVQRQYPDDFWANFELGHLASESDDEAGIGFTRAALALRPTSSAANFNLGAVLSRLQQRSEAIHHYERVLASDPNHMWAWRNLGVAYFDEGRMREAIDAFRHAIRLDASDPIAIRGLRYSLVANGQGSEARLQWLIAIEANPSDHETRDGYAELCLFLGDTVKYHDACADLLERFGDSHDPHVCERVGRACLLSPTTDECRTQAAELIERALSNPTRYEPWAHSYFLCSKALLEYRSGHWESALALLEGDVMEALIPAPHLIRAMALHQSGQVNEARAMFAKGLERFDWQADRATSREAWMFHILRREAESVLRQPPTDAHPESVDCDRAELKRGNSGHDPAQFFGNTQSSFDNSIGETVIYIAFSFLPVISSFAAQQKK